MNQTNLTNRQLSELDSLFELVSQRQIKDFGNISASNKEDGSLITSCDLWSDKTIVDGLASIAPDEGVLSEEGGKSIPNTKAYWIVDPLDGTTNFAAGIPYWSISVARFVDGIPQLDSNITLNGLTLTLGGTPSNGQTVEARGFGILNNVGAPSDGTVTNAKLDLTYSSNQYTGNGNTVDFTIPGGHTVDSVLVILDGLILPPADYSINSATLTFTNAPLNGQSIDIRYMPV